MSIQFAVGKIESVIDEFIEMKKKSFDAELKRTMRDIAFSDWDDTSQVVSLYRVTDMEGHKAAISAAQYLKHAITEEIWEEFEEFEPKDDDEVARAAGDILRKQLQEEGESSK